MVRIRSWSWTSWLDHETARKRIDIKRLNGKSKLQQFGHPRNLHNYLEMGGSSNHFARNPVPLQSAQHFDPFPAQITQLVFLDGTWQSMLSPRMKKPVPRHHWHSTCPLESQEEQAMGLGCWEISQAVSIRLTKLEEFSVESTIEARTPTLQTLGKLSCLVKTRPWRRDSLLIGIGFIGTCTGLQLIQPDILLWNL